jgi:parallel beta-helix repeat protein
MTIQGNHIGTNAAGTEAAGNGGSGIRIDEHSNVLVGGDTAAARNVISGNGDSGVRLGVSVETTTIAGNYIGVDVTGEAALPNDCDGVVIDGSSSDNTIGGDTPAEGNVIAANFCNGITINSIAAGATNHTIQNNLIGVTRGGAPMGQLYGIDVGGAGNTISHNTIAHNFTDGVLVHDATGNLISENSIHDNGSRGINNTDGGNGELAPPVITGFGSVTGTACSDCTIEVFSDDADEGRTYEGTTMADGSGNWTLPQPVHGPNVTATARDAANNTSEFSDEVPNTGPTPTPVASPTASVSPSPTLTATPTGTSGPSISPTPTQTQGPGESPTPTSTSSPTTSITAGPTISPTAAPDQLIWGDANCSGAADPVDSLLTLRHDAGLAANTGDCPDIGTQVDVTTAALRLWGDVDCNEAINPVDSLKLLRFDAGLSVAQNGGCPLVGSEVTIT